MRYLGRLLSKILSSVPPMFSVFHVIITADPQIFIILPVCCGGEKQKDGGSVLRY